MTTACFDFSSPITYEAIARPGMNRWWKNIVRALRGGIGKGRDSPAGIVAPAARHGKPVGADGRSRARAYHGRPPYAATRGEPTMSKTAARAKKRSKAPKPAPAKGKSLPPRSKVRP